MMLNENLKTLRERNGITQEELAKKLFVTRQTVSKWELGRSYPDLPMLQSLASFYGISLDGLVSKDEYAEAKEKGRVVRDPLHLSALVFTMILASASLVGAFMFFILYNIFTFSSGFLIGGIAFSLLFVAVVCSWLFLFNRYGRKWRVLIAMSLGFFALFAASLFVTIMYGRLLSFSNSAETEFWIVLLVSLSSLFMGIIFLILFLGNSSKDKKPK